MFDNKLGSRSRSGQAQVTKGHHTQAHRIKVVTHLVWAILHVENDVDDILLIRAHLGEPGQVKVRSKKVQIFNF